MNNRIYNIVSRIPYGQVATYGQIATLLGNKKLARVVGNVLHNNTDPANIPCHRVVNSKGQLANNFAFGGARGQAEKLATEGIIVNNMNLLTATHTQDNIHNKERLHLQENLTLSVDLDIYQWNGQLQIITANRYFRNYFGEKVYKLALDAGCTCPNRDGTIDTRGCIFCSAGGSGDFAGDRTKSITEQINEAKSLVASKMGKKTTSSNSSTSPSDSPLVDTSNKYIAYFQAFTNTYGHIHELKNKYYEAINHPDIVGISIATRPDCISDEVLDVLSEINEHFPLWVELGLQTIHAESARYIRRGYDLNVYDDAINRLVSRGIDIITHVIIGLPGETEAMMLETVNYVGNVAKKYKDSINPLTNRPVDFGIKLQLLHVLKNTDLEQDYNNGVFNTLLLEEYINVIHNSLAILPPDMVIHRLTGDGDKKLLVAPLWSSNKKLVLNELNKIYTC